MVAHVRPVLHSPRRISGADGRLWLVLYRDQAVTLTTTSPHRRVRIVGITHDGGLLRTIPEDGGYGHSAEQGYIDLQPDGNTFDLMAGLIMAKVH